LSGNEYHKG
jgi:hypothetical protein